ncbi:hypothetical protein DFAR_3000014 [Desulfarculales bacterium]
MPYPLLRPAPYGVYSNFKKCSLDMLVEIYKLEVPERHTALGNAQPTTLIFQHFLQIIEQEIRAACATQAPGRGGW